MNVKRCIYCPETKADGDFNREHLIPQSFGLFEESNLVLRCVCKACNTYFGSALDEKLACDSAEAMDRVAVGLNPRGRRP